MDAASANQRRKTIGNGPRDGDREWYSELRQTIRLAVPLVGSFVGAVAITTTDVIMMGWLGPESLAAGSLGYNLVFPLYLLGLGIILAVAPLTAQAFGAGDEAGVRRSLRQGLWMGFALAVPFGAVLWEGRAILLLFGQDPKLADMAEGYLRAVLWGLAPIFWYTALRSFLTALARTSAILIVAIAGVAVNALGNYALMFGKFGFPRLELVGAGLSTVIVDVFLFLGLLFSLVRQPECRRYGLFERFWRPDWPRFLALFRLGLPIGFGIIAGAFFFSAAIFLMGKLGTVEVAATTIVLQCMAVAFMAPLGIGHATMVRVGYHAGAGRPRSVRHAASAGYLVAIAALLAIAAIFLVSGERLVAFYLKPDGVVEGRVASLAAGLMATAALFQIFDGLQMMGVSVLRGLHAMRTAMWLAFFSFWGVGFSSCMVLGFGLDLGMSGVWWGVGLGLLSAAVLAGVMAWRAVVGLPYGKHYR